MAGHSHWKQVKHKKGAEDKKRSLLFSKLSKAISIAAREDSDPQFNPSLRSAIEKAKEFNMPQDNINRAIQRGAKSEMSLEEALYEAYGPGGVGMLINVVTDNTNRAAAEIKKVLKDFDIKLSEPGSVQWMFEREKEGSEWVPKFQQEAKSEKDSLEKLYQALTGLEDVQEVYTNLK